VRNLTDPGDRCTGELPIPLKRKTGAAWLTFFDARRGDGDPKPRQAIPLNMADISPGWRAVVSP